MTVGAYGVNAYLSFAQNAMPGAMNPALSAAMRAGQEQQAPMQYGRQTAAGEQKSTGMQPSMIPQLLPGQMPMPGSGLSGTMFRSIDGDRVELSTKMPGSGLLKSLEPEGECQTCANRKYMDGSDDPSVSYQSPTKINSSMAGAAVAAHEQEHVRHEQADAQKEGRQVVNQSVTLHYDTCPECGKMYVSGGTTRTTTVGKGENPMAKSEPEEGADNS